MGRTNSPCLPLRHQLQGRSCFFWPDKRKKHATEIESHTKNSSDDGWHPRERKKARGQSARRKEDRIRVHGARFAVWNRQLTLLIAGFKMLPPLPCHMQTGSQMTCNGGRYAKENYHGRKWIGVLKREANGVLCRHCSAKLSHEKDRS